jgi:ferrous iron transport protein A
MTLKDLRVGDRARIAGFFEGGAGSHSSYRRKLLSLGLTPGAELSVTRVAPMGDPVEIRVRGFALSLRRDEAATLSVEKLA